jgi:hypothetical protein
MLAEAEASVPEIAAITGHSYRTINSILEKYLPRTRHLAEMTMAKLENSLERFLQTVANRRFAIQQRRTQVTDLDGAPEKIRTPDPQILSYSPLHRLPRAESDF